MLPFLFLLVLGLVQGEEKCCPTVGCFNNNYPFDNMPLPECLDVIDPDMTLYTRGNPTEGQAMTQDTIPSDFSPSRRTVFIVHGYTQGSFARWMHDMKDAYLAMYDYNVIIVGWIGGALKLWYPQAASNTQVVGRYIGNTAQNLVVNGGSTPGQMWCVGHSLGSHTCGHAGTWYHIGRITGLDPAGPLFQNKDWTVGLNPSCADYVDCIHTHGTKNLVLGLGTLKPLGDVDFYPNGGTEQPGCILDPYFQSEDDLATLDVGTFIDLTPACSHLRVLDYWTEAILSPDTQCYYYSRQICYDAWNIPDSCINAGQVIQDQAPDSEDYPNQGYFYLTTNKAAPYCQS